MMIANVPSLSASSRVGLRQTDFMATHAFPRHGIAFRRVGVRLDSTESMLSPSGLAAAGADDHFDVCTVTGFAPLRDRAIPFCAQRPRRIPTRLRRSGPLGDKGSQPRGCWL